MSSEVKVEYRIKPGFLSWNGLIKYEVPSRCHVHSGDCVDAVMNDRKHSPVRDMFSTQDRAFILKVTQEEFSPNRDGVTEGFVKHFVFYLYFLFEISS